MRRASWLGLCAALALGQAGCDDDPPVGGPAPAGESAEGPAGSVPPPPARPAEPQSPARSPDTLSDVLRRAAAATLELYQGRAYLGSGVVLSADGIVVTCDHTIGRRTGLEARLPSGERLPLAPLEGGRSDDLAVLRLPAGRRYDHLSVLPRVPERGTELFLIATQRGLRDLMVTGRLARPGARLEWNHALEEYTETLFVDALSYPGASGAAWITAEGGVAAINAGAIWDPGRPGMMSYAVPCSAVAARNRPRTAEPASFRARFDAVAMVDDDLRAGLPLDADGIRIRWLARGSPLAAAGLAEGDVVARIGGTAFREIEPFLEHVRGLKRGAAVEIAYHRPGVRGLQTASVVPAAARDSCADE